MKKQDLSGWVLIQNETDEFYGQVQWRNEHGIMTDKKEIVEVGHDWKYRFCKSGMGKLVLVD